LGTLFKVIVIAGLAFFVWTRVLNQEIPAAIKKPLSQMSIPTAVVQVKKPVTTASTKTEPKTPANVPPAPTKAPVTIIVPTVVPECFIATAEDGHQFCSNGIALPQGDPRAVAGYCELVTDVYENYTCANGMPAGMVVEPFPFPTEMPWPTAAPEQYNVVDQCVTAIGPYGEQTVCNPDPAYPWSEGTKAFTAQMIIDVKIKSGTGPKG